LVVGIGLSAFVFTGSAAAHQDVKIEEAPFQTVMDQLFGTPLTPGLLEGEKHFDLRAEGITLTQEEADLFFFPTAENTSDFTDLISAAERNKAVLKIEGQVLDGSPFEFKLSGKQVKAEGLVLTQAEFDALIAQLRTLPGLKEAKIEATVDGQLVEAKLENQAGRVKIENRGPGHEAAKPQIESRGPKSEKNVRLVPLNHLDRQDRDDDHQGNEDRQKKVEKIEKTDKIERAAKAERPEKVQRVEKVERLEKIERIERPEHGGPGRR
jgi:hypothetical protein